MDRKEWDRLKKIYWSLAASFIILFAGLTVQAEGQTARPVVALGADLTEQQRATVLELMGLTEEDLANCNVITITNNQEHQYLDAYFDSKIIGTKSLSSVMLTKSETGSGVLVSTKNINYCTTGMYRNALLTAGLQDTSVLVVGPTQISGTAGLIGAIKSYEMMTGTAVSDKTIDTAMNELITTGELEKNTQNSEEVEQLVAYIKAKMAAGELETDDDIRNAINEGQNKFNVTLTDDEVNKIIDVMHKIKALGLDPQVLLNQAQDLYKKFGNDIVNHTEDIIKQSVSDSVKSYFSQLTDRVKNFFTSLIKK